MPSGRIGHEQSPRDFLSAGSDDPSALIATNGHDASPRTDMALSCEAPPPRDGARISGDGQR
jgi:hypothetical protein